MFPVDLLVRAPGDEWYSGVRDSKKLSAKKRSYYDQLVRDNFSATVSHVSVKFIEKYNINRAIQYGLYRSVQRLLGGAKVDPVRVVVFLDGKYPFVFPQIKMPRQMPVVENIIDGDNRTFSIAAASIVAKVERDRMIAAAADRFKGYGLEQNAGYGTKAHREAIIKLGPTPFHRSGYLRNLVRSLPLS